MRYAKKDGGIIAGNGSRSYHPSTCLNQRAMRLKSDGRASAAAATWRVVVPSDTTCVGVGEGRGACTDGVRASFFGEGAEVVDVAGAGMLSAVDVASCGVLDAIAGVVFARGSVLVAESVVDVATAALVVVA